MSIYRLPQSLNKYQSKMSHYFYAYAFDLINESLDMWQDLNIIVGLIDMIEASGFPCEEELQTLESLVIDFLNNNDYGVNFYRKSTSIERAQTMQEIKSLMKIQSPSAHNEYKTLVPTKKVVKVCSQRIEEIEAAAAIIKKDYPFGLTIKEEWFSWASSKKCRSYKYTVDQLSDAIVKFSWLAEGETPKTIKIITHRK